MIVTSRRSFLLGILGATLGGCGPAALHTPREEVAQFPLIDVHSHYAPRAFTSFGVTPEELLAAMDEAGIRRMIVLGFGPEVPEPNLSFDLSSKNAGDAGPGGGYETYPLHGLRGIDEGWRQLFEAYPDRILFGVDFLAARHLALAREIGDYYRGLLTRLTPATARKIGYENAQRLFRLG